MSEIIRPTPKSIDASRTGKSNVVYGLGYNANGLLGLGPYISFEECTEIKELSKQKIKEIFVGWDFELALNEDNQIFGWGRNNHGELGRGDNSKKNEILKPQKIDFQTKEKIKEICCGYHHTLVLSLNGLLYGWGDNQYGQLGLNKEESVNEPQIIEITENQEKFQYIHCYENSSFAITTNRLLFSWGYNGWRILGQGNNDDICIPRKVNLFNVQKISSYFL